MMGCREIAVLAAGALEAGAGRNVQQHAGIAEYLPAQVDREIHHHRFVSLDDAKNPFFEIFVAGHGNALQLVFPLATAL